MFTGIIEEVGSIDIITDKPLGVQFKISAIKIMDDLKIGDSIAVNGVCLTVVNHADNSFYLDIVNETLEKSNLGDLKKGDNVNLERSLKVSDRFGGHIVQGHVDITATVALVKKEKKGDTTIDFKLANSFIELNFS